MIVSPEVHTHETSTVNGPRFVLDVDAWDGDPGQAMLDRREVEVLREACDAFLAS